MPHKRNPITAERLSRPGPHPAGQPAGRACEDVALWHERDISHSSVERVILPDSSHLAYYSLRRAATLVDGLRVDAQRMLENLDRSYGLVFSQPVLLALVAGGLSRDDAYRIVQDDAMRSWTEGIPFRTLLEKDPRVTARRRGARRGVQPRAGAAQHAGAVFEALEAVRLSGGRVPFPLPHVHRGQGPRPLRRRRRAPADGRLRPPVGLRRGDGRAGARQGPHPHGDERVLVRAPGAGGRQPPDLDRPRRAARGGPASPSWPGG